MEVNCYENSEHVSVVPDFAQASWIYIVSGSAGRAVAGELNDLGGDPVPEMNAATPLLRVAQNTDSDDTPVQRTSHSN